MKAGETCFYFGTFNPIHSGHLMIAQAALRQFMEPLGIRSITFVPAGNPPLRGDEPDMLDARHRLNMVRLATADNPAFRVSDIEVLRPGRSFTIDTIRALIEQGKALAPVPMIIGSDALANLAAWHEPQALAETVCFLQAPRPESVFVHSLILDGREIPLNTQPIEMPLLAISSTWIRRQLRTSRQSCGGLRYYLAEPVRRYIADNALYQGG